MDNSAAAPPTVLVVDDDPGVRRALGLLLSKMYTVTACALATDALELLEGGARFDVVLCDNEMPGLSGPAFYEIIARKWPPQATRVVFVSSAEIDPSSAAATRPHVDKPFDPSVLRTLIAQLLAS